MGKPNGTAEPDRGARELGTSRWSRADLTLITYGIPRESKLFASQYFCDTLVTCGGFPIEALAQHARARSHKALRHAVCNVRIPRGEHLPRAGG